MAELQLIADIATKMLWNDGIIFWILNAKIPKIEMICVFPIDALIIPINDIDIMICQKLKFEIS